MTSDLASKEESSNWDTSQVEDALILYGRDCQVLTCIAHYFDIEIFIVVRSKLLKKL